MVEANNFCRKTERGRWGEEGMSMITTYTQVENYFGLHLSYLEIL